MEQKIEPLSAEDADRVESQRSWVRDHYEPQARHKYDSIEGKLALLDHIICAGWIGKAETWKLQSLGITLGDVFVQDLGMDWVAVEDEYGRDPAVRLPGTSIILFPLTLISKRIERGEVVDVRAFHAGLRQMIDEQRKAGT
jgi:hypothetical protein